MISPMASPGCPILGPWRRLNPGPPPKAVPHSGVVTKETRFRQAVFRSVEPPRDDAAGGRLRAARVRRCRHSAAVAAAAAAMEGGMDAAGVPQAQPGSKAARSVVRAACAAMLLAALHRVAFSVLAVPIRHQFALTLPQMGVLQSSLLLGYVVGQIPLGMAADRVGGARLLIACLFLWSLASLAFAGAPSATNPFAYMLAARAALGLCQSCIMPAVSSLSARWLPREQRSRYTSTIYAFYSIGTVAGLAFTPFLSQQVGWPATFMVFGLAGMAYSALTIFTLPPEGAQPQHRRRQPPPLPRQHGGEPGGRAGAAPAAQEQQQRRQQLGGGGAAAAAAQQVQQAQQAQQQLPSRLTPAVLSHLLLLCFTHSVISFAFFILQSWIPTYLHSLDAFGNLEAVGVLSALPWLATAAVSILAGAFADWLQSERRLPALAVRRLMQSVATLGTVLSLLPLALAPARALPAPAAVALLTLAVASQGFNYGGFHSYVQDVAPRDAGLVLGISNTCGTLAGITGNVAVGHLAGTPLGYQAVFALTVALHVAAFGLWTAGARGEELRLT